jgi:hypothetical protein
MEPATNVRLRARRRFLILVKTYPNPSESLAETVCTAAVDEDGKLVRLFPIPFRNMPEANRFKKWQWIEADVSKAPDPRPESFKVDTSTLKTIGEPMPAQKHWPERWKMIEHLVSPSMCVLDHLTPGRQTPSLGLIKPRDLDLIIEDLPENERSWTPKQLGNLMQQEGTADLFGAVRPSRGILEKMPVKISYKFHCGDPGCRGHTKMIEDWEICESWRSWQRLYPTREVLEQKIRQKYLDEPRRDDNLYFFVGTMLSHPSTWLIIGQIRPLHLRRSAIQDALL